jgi:hypothetical protein
VSGAAERVLVFVLITLAVAALGLAATFLLGAITAWSTDPREWSAFLRFIVTCLGLVHLGVVGKAAIEMVSEGKL